MFPSLGGTRKLGVDPQGHAHHPRDEAACPSPPVDPSGRAAASSAIRAVKVTVSKRWSRSGGSLLGCGAQRAAAFDGRSVGNSMPIDTLGLGHSRCRGSGDPATVFEPEPMPRLEAGFRSRFLQPVLVLHRLPSTPSWKPAARPDPWAASTTCGLQAPFFGIPNLCRKSRPVHLDRLPSSSPPDGGRGRGGRDPRCPESLRTGWAEVAAWFI